MAKKLPSTSVEDDEVPVPTRSKVRELHPIVDLRRDSRRGAKDFRPVMGDVAEPDDIELAILDEQLELGIDEVDLGSAEGESQLPQGKATTSS